MSKPAKELTDPAQLLLGFLDHYRSVVVAKLDGLSARALRSSALPSGWSPVELVNHLVFMERRWLCWGFAAQPLSDPLADEDGAGHWRAGPAISVESLSAALQLSGERTRAIVDAARWGDLAAVGGKFAAGDRRPTLGWILTYVLQEYARHAGHLDVARELVDGQVGE